MMKVKDLEKERLSWIMQVSPQKDPFKRKVGIPDSHKETDVILLTDGRRGFQPRNAGSL